MNHLNAMKLAIEALEDWKTYMLGHWDVIDEQAITSLRVAIASYSQAIATEESSATQERLELIGHADLAINNIYIFNGYGEDVPEGRTPIYAKYQQPKAEQRNVTKEEHDLLIKAAMRSATVVHDGFLTPKVNMLNTLAQPKAEQEPKREPLHQEHVFEAYRKALGQSVRIHEEAMVLKFARAIEAAHGIKGEV